MTTPAAAVGCKFNRIETNATDSLVPESVKAIGDLIVKEFNADKVLRAGRNLRKLEILAGIEAGKEGEEEKDESLSLSEAEKEVLKQWLNRPDIKGMRRMCAKQLHLFSLLSRDDGWTIVKKTDCRRQVRVLYSAHSGSSLHSFKIQATIRAEMVHCLTLCNEINLYGQWLPFFSKTEEVHRFHRNSRVAVVEWPMLWPMYWRDACVVGTAVDALDDEDNAILITCENLKKNGDGKPNPSAAGGEEEEEEEGLEGLEFPSRRGVCRISVPYAAMLLKPLSQHRLRMTAVLHVDPKLQYFPMNLVNWAATHVAYWGVIYFERRARDLRQANENDPHLQKVKTDREFYGELEQRLTEVFERLGMRHDEDLDDEEGGGEEDAEDVFQETEQAAVMNDLMGMGEMEEQFDYENEDREDDDDDDDEEEENANAAAGGGGGWGSWLWGWGKSSNSQVAAHAKDGDARQTN